MSETNNTPIMTDAFTDSNYLDFFIELYGEDELLRLRPFAPRLGFMVFITTPPSIIRGLFSEMEIRSINEVGSHWRSDCRLFCSSPQNAIGAV